ncbi:MAG: LLM class F420-dependent oxidoreductase [Xanthomonadales bacterium]|nr:LLM class F420-dependent oxidoreductase [Xanthomonadales bacterium]
MPFDDVPLAEHRERVREIADLGYDHLWAGEADALDAVVPLAAAAAWAPELAIGTAIVPAFTRGPAVLAMTAAALSELVPGRVSLGIGASSPIVVERWNGIEHRLAWSRVRDTVRFLDAALAGTKVVEQYETFSIDGFRLGRVPEPVPDILVAALRPRMLHLAASEAGGAILTWLSAEDVTTVTKVLHEAAPERSPRVVCWLTVCPSTDAEAVRARARPLIAAYLNVPTYAAFHEWLGRGDVLAPVWARWRDGDRAGAVRAVPDELVDELIIHGPPEQCREQIERYRERGAAEPALAIQPGCGDPMEALRSLAPR